jgi:outer membrane protein OmpA-like peptidoglycan-associated protein
VLVEGIRSDEPTTACGGIVLNPVRTSNLTTAACSRTIVPAGDYPGRPYKSPPEQLRPASEPRMLPTGPYDARTFSIYFEFGRDFLVYQYAEMILEKIMLYAKASQAHDVLVEGYAATEPLYVRDAGRAGLRRPVHEDSQLATARANMVAEALRRLGVPAATVRVQAHTAPAATADLEQGKLPEPSKRRVVVTITP